MTASFRLVLVLLFHNIYNLHAVSVWKVEDGVWLRKQKKLAGLVDDVNSSVVSPKIVAPKDTTVHKKLVTGGKTVNEKTTDKVTKKTGKSKIVKEKVVKKTIEKIVEVTTVTTTCTPKTEIKIVGSSMSDAERKERLAKAKKAEEKLKKMKKNKTAWNMHLKKMEEMDKKHKPVHSSMGAKSAFELDRLHKAEMEKKAKEKIGKARAEKNSKIAAANAKVEEAAKKAAAKGSGTAEEKLKKEKAAKVTAEKLKKIAAKKAAEAAKAKAAAEKGSKLWKKKEAIAKAAWEVVKSQNATEERALMMMCRKRSADIVVIVDGGGSMVAHKWDKYLTNSLVGMVDQDTSMSLLTFGKHGQRMVSLTHNQTRLKHKVKGLEFVSNKKQGATETAVALGSARMELKRNGRASTANVVVVISHGIPNTEGGKAKSKRAAEAIKRLNYRLIFAEVGFDGGEKYFQTLASAKTDVISVSHSCHLTNKVKQKLMAMKIKHAICSGCAQFGAISLVSVLLAFSMSRI